MTVDLSLRQSLRRRSLDPSLGVRQLAPPGTSVAVRSLIPPPGGGTGGGPGNWGLVGTWQLMMPDTLAHGLSLCAAAELWIQVAPDGSRLNIDGGPLKLGDAYWIYSVIHFPAFASHFLDGRLPSQDFRFRLTLRLPGGTCLGPDKTIWWRIALADDKHEPDVPLILPSLTLTPGRDTGYTFWDWFWSSSGGPGGSLSLQRGCKLSLATCLVSTESFTVGKLGLELRSQVGWALGLSQPVGGHWGKGGDTITFVPNRRLVFCLGCQQVVSLPPPDWSACPRCGSAGPLLMRPVVPPDYFVMTVPIGFY